MMTGETTVQTRNDLPWLPPGSTARLVVCDEIPPLELVTTAFVLAFDSDALLMAYIRADGRGWNPPGGHREPDEGLAETAAREAREEACAIVTDLRPFGFEHIRRAGPAGSGPYPHPDGYQVFFLGGVQRLERFVETDEVADRALLAPNDARQVPWVGEHRPFYELALAAAERPLAANE